MPIRIPDALPAAAQLESENILSLIHISNDYSQNERG